MHSALNCLVNILSVVLSLSPLCLFLSPSSPPAACSSALLPVLPFQCHLQQSLWLTGFILFALVSFSCHVSWPLLLVSSLVLVRPRLYSSFFPLYFFSAPPLVSCPVLVSFPWTLFSLPLLSSVLVYLLPSYLFLLLSALFTFPLLVFSSFQFNFPNILLRSYKYCRPIWCNLIICKY